MSVSRRGTYGAVEYVHVLECEHIEVRKRASRDPEIACGSCGTGSSLRKAELSPSLENLEIAFASTENAAGAIRAAIAQRLRIDADAVNVIISDDFSGPKIIGVTVYLSTEEALRLC